ncbi:hypothetical protein DRQ53_14075 [bacterium]|nr:MAG: hypothetical protein DRQ53_14075 [bacterium]
MDDLAGEEVSKERLRVILETIAREKSVNDACEELGIERVRFHELRTKALQAGIEALTPKKPGRKRKVKSAEELRIEELERKVSDLKQEVYTQSMKEAIHIALDRLGTSSTGDGKGGSQWTR